MKLSEIIPDDRSLVTRDYWERRNQLRIPGPEFKPEYGNNPDNIPRNARWQSAGTPQFDGRGGPLKPLPIQSQQSPQNSGQNKRNLTELHPEPGPQPELRIFPKPT